MPIRLLWARVIASSIDCRRDYAIVRLVCIDAAGFDRKRRVET